MDNKNITARIVDALSTVRKPISYSDFPSDHTDFPEDECLEECNWTNFYPNNYELAARVSPLLNDKGFHFIWLNYMRDFLENPIALQGNEFTSVIISMYGNSIESSFADEINKHFNSFTCEDLLLVADWAVWVDSSAYGKHIDNFQGFIDRISTLLDEIR